MGKRGSASRSERDVWEIVNRGRRKKKRVNENIEEKKWRDYFMRLLKGVDHRVVGGDGEL